LNGIGYINVVQEKERKNELKDQMPRRHGCKHNDQTGNEMTDSNIKDVTLSLSMDAHKLRGCSASK